MRLAGLAFETANRRSGSICAAACTLLKDGKVTDCQEWWISPHTALHSTMPDFSLTRERQLWEIKDCPEFPVVWTQLLPMLLATDCVIMHDAPFNLKHLRSVMAFYQLPSVTFPYADSMEIARQLLPGMRSYTMKAIASRFGVTFHRHHALEDATARAMIVCRLGLPSSKIEQFSTR